MFKKLLSFLRRAPQPPPAPRWCYWEQSKTVHVSPDSECDLEDRMTLALAKIFPFALTLEDFQGTCKAIIESLPPVHFGYTVKVELLPNTLRQEFDPAKSAKIMADDGFRMATYAEFLAFVAESESPPERSSIVTIWEGGGAVTFPTNGDKANTFIYRKLARTDSQDLFSLHRACFAVVRERY